jgi:DNA-binding CsgD family transcriptional regulator
MAAQQPCDNKIKTLTKREREVAECAAQGQTNKQIADQLRISTNTVKNHLFRVFEKLGLSNRIELPHLFMNEHKGSTQPSGKIGYTAQSIQFYLRAAEEGFAAAQFILGRGTPPITASGWLKIPPNSETAVFLSSRSSKPR